MIDDQTLTLYYWRDGLTDDERRSVEAALASDAVLAARYRQLVAELESLTGDALTPAPGHRKHQWHDLLEREARLERQKAAASTTRRPLLGLGAAFAAVLALGVGIGIWVPGQAPGPGPGIGPKPVAIEPVTDPVPTAQPASFERGLQLYLRESRSELADLGQRDAADRDALLAQIIAQNRLFERAAEKQQAPDIARVMRAIEPILLRLADAETSPEDAEALRRQLAFELNAVLTRLQQPASKPTTI
ncbi:hypothetical protein F3N42_01300 [Marinihelvus fidelis]|uniref:Uncharacterized protein n=1 Tax=Marinihelvus fidelis TaxID=2613842 RepID=A0A5N0TI87_9GAMM|nr:hypothetical protein [Marinihelvus fidelis]KAA9134208.1 hypothetical protein F3N42_01300 [Marinihelvus fidelis]